MRTRTTLTLLCFSAGLLIGCGSGGSSSGAVPGEQVQRFQLGMLRADAPTTVPLVVAKPRYGEGTFELAEPPVGAFAPAEGTLPMTAESGPDSRMWITFTPPAAHAPGLQDGTIQLLFRAEGWKPMPVTLQLQAKVELPSARLLQTQVSAGNAIVGETVKFGMYIENTSAATTITVTDVTAPDGDFSFAPDAFPLPAQVGPGSRFFFRLQYSPKALGSSSSFIRVYHSASEQPLEAAVTGTGVEKPSARLLQTDVSAGSVVVGDKVELGVDFENTSAATTVTVKGLTLPDGEFTIAPDAPALPVDVAPGATLHLPLVYAPQGVWDASAVLLVRHSAAAEPLEATVSGSGISPRIVTYYSVPLDTDWTFESDWQEIDVPAAAVGIFLEATGDPDSVIDLIGLEGPLGTVYENYDMTGPLGWMSNYPAGGRGYLNVELPNSEDPAVQLDSGGGKYLFRLRDSAQKTGWLQVRVTVVQRTAATVEEGTLDLRVYLADGFAIDPSYAMGDYKIYSMLTTLDAILGTNGIRLGNISFVTMDPWYDWLWDEGMTEDMIVTNTSGFSEGALNLFLVTEMDYGIASVAGAVPGPTANGAPFSGVVMDFNETKDGIALGAIAAHQIVHYLGTETEEVIPLPGEAYPALRHPLLNPGLPQDLLSPPDYTDYPTIVATIEGMPAMDTWCGTCGRKFTR